MMDPHPLFAFESRPDLFRTSVSCSRRSISAYSAGGAAPLAGSVASGHGEAMRLRETIATQATVAMQLAANRGLVAIEYAINRALGMACLTQNIDLYRCLQVRYT
jgi:hypothetical protein